MIDFVYDGKKALLITSDDLMQSTERLSPSKELHYKLPLLRKNGYRWIFVVTSFRKTEIPKEIRRFLTSTKHCFVGRIPNDFQ